MKREKLTAIIVLVLVLMPVCFIVGIFYGNPFLRIYYYFEGKEYLAEKYTLETQICSTEYDFKTDSYYLTAEAPAYNNVGFKVYIEKNSDEVEFWDDLSMMKWSCDITEEIQNEILAVYPNAEIRAGFSRDGVDIYENQSHIEEIDNYFTVNNWVGGDINVVITTNINYSSLQLDSAFEVYKIVEEVLKPKSFRLYYNNGVFSLPYGIERIRNKAGFSNYFSLT